MGSFRIVKLLNPLGTDNQVKHGLSSITDHILKKGRAAHGIHISHHSQRKRMT